MRNGLNEVVGGRTSRSRGRESEKGERTNTTTDKAFQTTDPLTNPPDKIPREQLRENLYKGLFSGFFVLGVLKVGGSEICDVLFWGVPACVTKCDRGGRSKLAKNSVTYFMDGPLDCEQLT